MHSFARPSYWLIVGVLLMLGSLPAAQATPYMTPDEIARMQPVWDAGAEDAIYGVPDGGLDDLEDYVLTVEQVNVLDWLTTMQELSPGLNYGGMHEGETSTWNIIQTDNTAEACRDWSHYARMTGDLDRYETNILAAWEYQFNFPAYSEEGGGNPNYYRTHNAGWALVAAMEYTEAYGEWDEVLTYADSCANYLTEYQLQPSNILNAFSGSFGAGCLYTYSQWRGGHPEWTSAAQDHAHVMQTYVENNPGAVGSRNWAMSGGTLMWGIITALFLDDPDAGADWLPTYLTELPTYSGTANWNNSHTVWNGFAWHRAYQVLGDDDSLANARFVMDYLFDQMYLDDDSGVPGTENTNEDDQSWTTAYTVWYELEQLFTYYDGTYDVAAVSVESLTPNDDIVVGGEVQLAVTVANGGLEPLGPDTQMAYYQVTTPATTLGPYPFEVPYGQQVTLELPDLWIPAALGEAQLTVQVGTDGDFDTGNNEAATVVTVLSPYTISGTISDATNGAGVDARVSTAPVGPGVSSLGFTNPSTGEYTLYVEPGTYTFTVLPQEAPYPPRVQTVTIAADDFEIEIDYELPRASQMYVINGPLNLALTGYQRMKNLFGPGFDPCVWPVSQLGMPLDELTYLNMNTVFWSHLVPEGPIVVDEQYDALNDFLETPGTLMVLSGGSLMNVIDFEERLRFGVAPGQLDLPQRVVASNPGDALGGDSLFIQLPQSLPIVDAVNGFHPSATRLGYYANTTRAAGQRIAWPEGSVSMTLGFPLEACDPNRGFFADDAALAWVEEIREHLNSSSMVAGSESATALPGEWSLAAYPNPFNPVLHVTVESPVAERATVGLYDLLGRRVAHWTLQATAGTHTVSWSDPGAASGVYLLRLDAGSQQFSRRVTLLK